jgi:hypothetical protein
MSTEQAPPIPPPSELTSTVESPLPPTILRGYACDDILFHCDYYCLQHKGLATDLTIREKMLHWISLD